MLPIIKVTQEYEYIGNPKLISDFQQSTKGYYNEEIVLTIDFKNEEGKIETFPFVLNVLKEEEIKFSNKIDWARWDSPNAWLIVSQFLIHINDWYPEVERHLEESKFHILVNHSRSNEYVNRIKSMRTPKKETIAFEINNLFISVENAENFYTFAKYVLKNNDVITKLKDEIQHFLDKKLVKKRISEETHAAYRSGLERFYYWFLARKTNQFPKVTQEVIEDFKKESQQVLNKGYYLQKKPLSLGYVNQTLKNLQEFIENYKGEEIGAIELFSIPPRIKEVYGGELEEIDQNFLYLIEKYRFFEEKGDAKLSSLRDKFRNLLLFRLSLETMLPNSQLLTLTFNQFNLNKGCLHIQNREIYLTQDTLFFLKAYHQFRKRHDQNILKWRLHRLDSYVLMSFLKRLFPEEEYVKILPQESEIKEIDKKIANTKEAKEIEELIEERDKLEKKNEERLLELGENGAGLLAEMAMKHSLMNHIFISNQHRILSLNAVEKIFKSVSVKGMNLGYTREKHLADLNVPYHVIQSLGFSKAPKFDIEITDKIKDKIVENMFAVRTEEELTEIFKEKLIRDRILAIANFVSNKGTIPNVKTYRKKAEAYYKDYTFVRERLNNL